MANNKPTATLRDGLIKATIWKQQSKKGDFYRANFTRRYKDGTGEWRDGDSFSGTELLQLARLASKAYDRTSELRQQERDAPEATPDDGRRA